MSKKKKIVHVSGKRRKAIARATLKEGKGDIRINSKHLDTFSPRHLKLMIEEALELAGDAKKGIDISINVKGGGVVGQAEAIALCIAKGLTEWTGSEALKEKYESYDRHLIVPDSRQKETNKPGRSSARSSAQKSKR